MGKSGRFGIYDKELLIEYICITIIKKDDQKR